MCRLTEQERELIELKHSRVFGKKIVLVRYRPKHVSKYHQWMQSTELQQTTCSEPLTIEEEYEMQQKWVKDSNKLTFIVLDRLVYEQTNGDEIAAMIGDTNIFLPDSTQEDLIGSGEIEIMIAEPSHRRNGKGREAVELMLRLGHDRLGIDRFVAKINMDNPISQTMFENIGFIKTGESAVFQHVTMEMTNFQRLAVQIGDLQIEVDDRDELDDFNLDDSIKEDEM